MRRRPHVAVVGPGDADPLEEARAEAVGRALAEGGAVVVTGGLGGAMAAACRGARAGGGPTIGLLPGLDRDAANPWVDVALPTGLGEGRNLLVVRAADVVVAVGGAFGTLSEIALALRAGIAVVGLGTWELRRGGVEVDAVVRAADPVDAAGRALALARGRSPAGGGEALRR